MCIKTRKKQLEEYHAERVAYANEMYVKDIFETRAIMHLPPLSPEEILKNLRERGGHGNLGDGS